MKIEQIKIEGFLGLPHFSADISEPVLLVCGPNGSGKSSMVEAVRFALTGETPRAALKKELQALLSAGKKSGKVALQIDGATVSRDIKTGAATGAPQELGALAYTLDAPRLAAMDAKARRAALFGLMGVSFTPDVVARELVERGHNPEHVERIKPLLRAGFDTAASEARKLAAEARGAWKEVTGETYGSVKAEAWSAPAAPQNADAGHDRPADHDVAALRSAYEDAVRAAATLRAQKTAADQAESRLQQLRERASKATGLRADVAKLEARLAANGPAQTPIGDCPKCGTALATASGELVVAAKIAAELPDPTLAGALDAVRRELQGAEQAQAIIDEMGEQGKTAAPTEAALNRADGAIEVAKLKLDAAEAQHRAACESRRAAAENSTRTARARELHEMVSAWAGLEAALSPNGLPAELLARALKPMNDALERVHAASGWPLVVVTDDIAITAGGRPYGLLSESEKWRADAALAYAAAALSGCGLVLLDRFDVLDVPARSQFMRLAIAQASYGVQTIAAGTLKAPPAAISGATQVVWLGEGEKN